MSENADTSNGAMLDINLLATTPARRPSVHGEQAGDIITSRPGRRASSVRVLRHSKSALTAMTEGMRQEVGAAVACASSSRAPR
jgi:hypothetical protein